MVVKHKAQKIRLLKLAFLLAIIFYIALKPQEFIDLWLTEDQQGHILFNHGNYKAASNTFTNVHWQAFSAYGSEEYDTAALLYSQFSNKENLLAQANALAHGRNYIKARDLYQSIIDNNPDYQAAKTNRDIVQAIIDEVNLLSESQQPEQGESIKELGDEPQTGDGGEKQEARKNEIEQLSSEQLLLDSNLNEMWLRQVQKDPANFLSQKFYIQHMATKKQKVNNDE